MATGTRVTIGARTSSQVGPQHPGVADADDCQQHHAGLDPDGTNLYAGPTALGLRFQQVSQVLQEYPQMEELRVDVEELTGVAEPAKQQMLVRVGRSKQQGLSPRRDLASMIRG